MRAVTAGMSPNGSDRKGMTIESLGSLFASAGAGHRAGSCDPYRDAIPTSAPSSGSAPITSPSMSCFCVIGTNASTVRQAR